MDELINNLTIQITKLKVDGARIAAFGASAKGNTLLNACLIRANTIDYIVDDTPEKIGKFSPGKHIPIVSINHFRKHPPDIAILCSWNHKKEIIKKEKNFNRIGGKWISHVK